MSSKIGIKSENKYAILVANCGLFGTFLHFLHGGLLSMLNELALFLILTIGGYDVWLILAGKETISCRFQRYFPTWVDMILLVAVVIVIYMLPILCGLKVLLAALAGHVFFPNRERYRTG